MSDNRLLTAKGDELSRLLGEVLGNYGEHDWTFQRENIKPPYKAYCVICGKKNKTLTLPLEKCTKANSIPLDDWNAAMKWRDWAVGKYGDVVFVKHMRKVAVASTGYDIVRSGEHWTLKRWMIAQAQPEHYLIAAALCKESEGE